MFYTDLDKFNLEESKLVLTREIKRLDRLVDVIDLKKQLSVIEKILKFIKE